MSLSEEAITLQRAAHELMYLGMDGSPVYSDDLAPKRSANVPASMHPSICMMIAALCI